MPFKPNYNHARMERDRAKAARKEEKQREKEERKKAGAAPEEGMASEVGADIAGVQGERPD